ncbi:hypothetical protein HIM_01328 [Hirsutella minnesotensis 3608]|nr:hypothetical protein HIM_01328 [Hirsutella minnesotensis 3608]
MDDQASPPGHHGEADGKIAPTVRLLAQRHASTEETASPLRREGLRCSGGDSSIPFYSSAQWTADGTTIMVCSSDNTVSSVVLPADLLQHEDQELHLAPQSTTQLPEPTQAIAPAPFFSLTEAATQTYLVACRDHPLHLYHAFPVDANPAPLATYKLIRFETEEYITPASLLWQGAGTHFLCGSVNRLDYFDVTRHGSEGPILTIPTIPSKRHVVKGGGVGMKGTVAALATSPVDTSGASLVAAGTRTRWIGLYDLNRSSHCVANWSLSHAGEGEGEFAFDCTGQGIVQLLWSSCGRYLVVNERQSNDLLVYDIRGSGKLLSALEGRKATTQQRLSCDVYQGAGNNGFEVWAGSQDGSVLVWEDVGMQYGVVQSSWTWKAHESPVGSVAMHSCGSVAATCSGAWEHASEGAIESFGIGRQARRGNKTMAESSLKVWSIGA